MTKHLSHIFKTSELEAAEGPGRNPTGSRTMGDVIAARFSRRGFLQGSMATTAIAAMVGPMAMTAARPARAQVAGSAFDFPEVMAGVDADHHVAEGYDADILLRWGDPIFADAPAFDPMNQSAEAQERQFGYNNDFVGYIPLNGSSERGILVVNHEYTNEHLMFPGIVTFESPEPPAAAGVALDEETAEPGSPPPPRRRWPRPRRSRRWSSPLPTALASTSRWPRMAARSWRSARKTDAGRPSSTAR